VKRRVLLQVQHPCRPVCPSPFLFHADFHSFQVVIVAAASPCGVLGCLPRCQYRVKRGRLHDQNGGAAPSERVARANVSAFSVGASVDVDAEYEMIWVDRSVSIYLVVYYFSPIIPVHFRQFHLAGLGGYRAPTHQGWL
jgi:hypothetical protein